MSNQPTKQRRIGLRTWAKIAMLALIVFGIVILLLTHRALRNMEQQYEELKQQALELEQENQRLQNYITNQGTDDGTKDVAQGELGMIDPDTIIYDFE